MEHARHSLPEADADNNAERDPERQEPLEFPHGRGFCCFTAVHDGCRFAHEGRPRYPVALTVYDRLAVFLRERAALRIGKNVQHGLGGAAQLHAARRDDNRAIDEDGVRHHGVDQLVIRQGGIVQLQFVVGCSLPAQQITHRNPHAADQTYQLLPARRGFQIFDDDRLFAAVADQAEDVARRAACRVVVDRDRHAAVSRFGEQQAAASGAALALGAQQAPDVLRMGSRSTLSP